MGVSKKNSNKPFQLKSLTPSECEKLLILGNFTLEELLCLLWSQKINLKDFIPLVEDILHLREIIKQLQISESEKKSMREIESPKLIKDPMGNIERIITKYELEGRPIVFADIGELVDDTK